MPAASRHRGQAFGSERVIAHVPMFVQFAKKTCPFSHTHDPVRIQRQAKPLLILGGKKEARLKLISEEKWSIEEGRRGRKAAGGIKCFHSRWKKNVKALLRASLWYTSTQSPRNIKEDIKFTRFACVPLLWNLIPPLLLRSVWQNLFAKHRAPR